MKKATFVSLFLVLALLGSLLTVGVSAEDAVDPVLSLWQMGHDQGYQAMEKVEDGVKFTELQVPAGIPSNSYINWLGMEDGFVDFSNPVTMSFTINEVSSPAADAAWDEASGAPWGGWATVPCFMADLEGAPMVTINIAKTHQNGGGYIYAGTHTGNHTDLMQTLTDVCTTYYLKFDLPNKKVLFGTTADETTWVNLMPETVDLGTTFVGAQFFSRVNFTGDEEARGKWVYTFHEFNGTKMTEPSVALADGAANITMNGTSITLDANYEKKTLADLKALLALPEGFEVTFLNGATALADTDELGETTTIMIANGDMEVPLYVVTLDKAFGTEPPAPDDEDDNKDDTTPDDEGDNKDDTTPDDEDDNKDDTTPDEEEELPPATGVSVSVAAVLLAGASAGVLGLTSKKSKK